MIPQVLFYSPSMYGIRTDSPNAFSRQYPTNTLVEAEVILFDPDTKTVLWQTTTKGGECSIRGLEQRAYQVVGIRLDTREWLAQKSQLTAQEVLQ